MVNAEEAEDFRKFIIEQLNSNGFSHVVNEANIRVHSLFEQENNNQDAVTSLRAFLNETINVLRNLSNDHFQILIDRLNKFVSSDKGIETVEVHIGEFQENYDLKNLPDYKDLIKELSAISELIFAENEPNDPSKNSSN